MKSLHIACLLLFLFTSLAAQYDPRENFYDAEFFFSEEDYAEALYAFTKVYNEGYQENANINYRMGVCMLNIDGKKTDAIPYLEKASKNITDKYREGNFKEEMAPPDAWLYLGNAYRIAGEFDKAIGSYNKFLEYFPGGDSEDPTGQAHFARIQIEACEKAKTIDGEEKPYTVGTLGQLNMIQAPIYNPVVSGDLGTLSFMGRQKFYNGVYISRNEDGKWSKPYNITPWIQSDGNQDVVGISHDGNAILLAWYSDFDSDIWISRYENDRWNKSEPIGKPVNSKYWESHASLTPDEKTIYFSSNRKESLGGMDIFRCTRLEDGTWGAAELLGEKVNTPLNEENPYVSTDGKKLYFSSQGHAGGLGGFDIFWCEIMPDGTLGDPVHPDYPLNTTDDDFVYMPELIEFDDYLTLYARGGSEQVDIFRFELIPQSAQPVAVAFETVTEPVAEVTEEQVAEQEPVQTEPAPEEVLAETETPEEEVVEPVPAEPEPVTEVLLLRPVYFDFDSQNLSETAQRKLDDLAAGMQRFPELRLEVIGHTDAVGSMDYNFALAQRRADAVTEYLVSKGVARERFVTRSKGETEHVALNRTPDNHDSPKGRALNRRVQFRVTVDVGIAIEQEIIEVPDELKID